MRRAKAHFASAGFKAGSSLIPRIFSPTRRFELVAQTATHAKARSGARRNGSDQDAAGRFELETQHAEERHQPMKGFSPNMTF